MKVGEQLSIAVKELRDIQFMYDEVQYGWQYYLSEFIINAVLLIVYVILICKYPIDHPYITKGTNYLIILLLI